ncbi:MAG: hypothetical protein AAFN13_16755 [Bacteroidota bacterium]
MLASLPDSARAWFFTAGRQLAPTERTNLLESLSPFLREWQSHGRPVPAEATVLYDRFLIVGAHIDDDAPNAGVSGCGIDAMTHAVMNAAEAVGVAWVDGLQIAYAQPDGTPCVVSRRAFRALARDGIVDGATPVFVTTLTTVGAVRSQGLRQPASCTWHGRTFRLAETA